MSAECRVREGVSEGGDYMQEMGPSLLTAFLCAQFYSFVFLHSLSLLSLLYLNLGAERGIPSKVGIRFL